MPESKSGALPLGDSPAVLLTLRPAALQPCSEGHANAARGWHGSVRATKPRAPCSPFNPAAHAALARCSESKQAKTQPPDPLIRAVLECKARLARAAATSGYRAVVTACRSLRP